MLLTMFAVVLVIASLFLRGFFGDVANLFFLVLCHVRFLPPENICPNGRKKATLPKEATNVLRNWLESNPHPYPTREAKAALADLTGLTTMQV